MALPTMAQWTDELALLTQFPTLGTKFLDASPFFFAFGPPQSVARGKLKVNWAKDATAASPSTAAGAPHTGAPAQVDANGKFTLDFAAIASQAYTDIGIDMMGPSFAANNSMENALSGIYDGFVNQAASDNDGTDYKLWGAGDITASEDTYHATATMVVSGSYTSAAYDSDQSEVLNAIELGTLKLNRGDGSYNIGLCDDIWYKNIKKQVRKVGGNTVPILAGPQFGMSDRQGYETLYYDGVYWYNTKHLTNTNDESTSYIFNVGGASGCTLVVPQGEDMFLIQGPKWTKGELSEVWDIALKVQLVPKSGRAITKLVQIAK